MTTDILKGVRKREVRCVYAYSETQLASAIKFWQKQDWQVMDTRQKNGLYVARMDHVYVKERKS